MYWPQIIILLFKLLYITGFKLNDVSYYDMPRLYALEEYSPCEVQKGVYCYGSFELLPFNNPSMFQALEDFSSKAGMLNHTRVVRGYCLNRSCSNIVNGTDTHRFTKCVSQDINIRYNLSTRPLKSPHCFTQSTAERIDTSDIAFLLVIILLAVCNIIGTLYDLYSNENNKRNKYLLAWSMSSNWKHLTNTEREADHKALHGVRSIIGLCVMQTHLINVHMRALSSNPEVIENFRPFETSLYASATTTIFMFSWLSSYFLVNKTISLKKRQTFISEFLRMLVQRLVRILPVTMFAITLQATWWRHAGSGPMWHSLVTEEAKICRRYWWTHLLFINNFWQQDEKCLGQTWFIAADMQVYILILPLVLLISKFKTATALRTLSAMFCASLLFLFVITYAWDLKPILYIDSKHVVTQWIGEESFNWLYAAPYSCLPLALTGAWCAFALKYLRNKDIQLSNLRWFLYLHVASLPLYLAWLSASHWMKAITTPLFIAAYSVTNQIVFAVLLSIFLMGSIHGLRAYSILSWDIWRIPSRMSLAVLVLHLSYCYSIAASTNKENNISYMRFAVDFPAVYAFTYTAALPTTVLLESPFIQTYNAIISKN